MKTHSVLPIFAIGPVTRRDIKKNSKKPDPVIYYQVCKDQNVLSNRLSNTAHVCTLIRFD